MYDIKIQETVLKLPLKPADIIIILLALALIVFCAHTAYLQPEGRTSVFIRVQDNESVFYMDNNKDETIVLKGQIGNTIVRIENGRAWIDSSPCENQTCVATGAIFRAGQWAACLPNSVLIMMQSNLAGDKDVDAITW
jgi:hypothetical protein